MIREQAHSGAESDCQESARLCVYFSVLPPPALPPLGCPGWAWLSWGSWSLHTCSASGTCTPGPHQLLKAWSCSLSLPLCCGHFALSSWELYVCFWAVFRIFFFHRDFGSRTAQLLFCLFSLQGHSLFNLPVTSSLGPISVLHSTAHQPLLYSNTHYFSRSPKCFPLVH